MLAFGLILFNPLLSRVHWSGLYISPWWDFIMWSSLDQPDLDRGSCRVSAILSGLIVKPTLAPPINHELFLHTSPTWPVYQYALIGEVHIQGQGGIGETPEVESNENIGLWSLRWGQVGQFGYYTCALPNMLSLKHLYQRFEVQYYYNLKALDSLTIWEGRNRNPQGI